MWFFCKETKSVNQNYMDSATTPTSKGFVALTPNSTTQSQLGGYSKVDLDVVASNNAQVTSCIENVAKWFLNKSSLSHKKLQKLCYYAYCWFIVFFNDIEEEPNVVEVNWNLICKEKFQAWIHGPVCPELYQQYKKYGWKTIPKTNYRLNFDSEIENLLGKVWSAYGKFSADELEELSHSETPWINARKGKDSGDACYNEISPVDIFLYFSSLS